MSVVIDGKNMTKFIEFGNGEMGGRRRYSGHGIDDEGKKIESWIKEWPQGKAIRIEDTHYRVGPTSAVCIVVETNYSWKDNVLSFNLAFDLYR